MVLLVGSSTGFGKGFPDTMLQILKFDAEASYLDELNTILITRSLTNIIHSLIMYFVSNFSYNYTGFTLNHAKSEDIDFSWGNSYNFNSVFNSLLSSIIVE